MPQFLRSGRNGRAILPIGLMVIFLGFLVSRAGDRSLGTGSSDHQGQQPKSSEELILGPTLEEAPSATTDIQPALLSETDPSTFYVSANGNDSADGQAPETAWLSLDPALRRLSAGQTLFVMNGRYEQPLSPGRGGHFRLSQSGTASAWIRVVAMTGHNPVLVGTDGSGLEISGSYIEVSGLEIAGQGYSTSNNFGMGIELADGVNLIVSNNKVHGFPLGGIAANRSAGVQIFNNTVYQNGYWNPDQGSGISIWLPQNRGQSFDQDGYTDRIYGNIVFANENKVAANGNAQGQITDGNGIIIDSGRQTGYQGRFLVMNNISVGNGGRGIHVFDTDHVDIIHNTTYQNGFTAALWPGGSELSAYRASDVRFLNNVAVALPGKLPILVGEASAIESAGNVLVGGVASSIVDESDQVLADGPVFVSPHTDPRQANFALSTDSNLFGSALELDLPIGTDFYNRSRGGNTAEPGAIESTTKPVAATTPTTTTARTPDTSKAQPNPNSSPSTAGRAATTVAGASAAGQTSSTAVPDGSATSTSTIASGQVADGSANQTPAGNSDELSGATAGGTNPEDSASDSEEISDEASQTSSSQPESLAYEDSKTSSGGSTSTGLLLSLGALCLGAAGVAGVSRLRN